MGKVYSLLLRPVRRFNIENRAQRVISRQKPISAPQYPSTKKQKEMTDKLNPNFMETHYEKDPTLHDYLKSVYVSSIDPQDKLQGDTATSTKPLPQARSQSSLKKSRSYESSVTVKGKCSLIEAIQFITMHQTNPTEHSVEKISQEYQLDKQTVENIVSHFKIMNILEPEKKQLGGGRKTK